MRRIKVTGIAFVAVLAIAGASASGASANITCSKLSGSVSGAEGFLRLRDCTPAAEGFKSMVTTFKLESTFISSWAWPRTSVGGALEVETHDEGVALSCARNGTRAVLLMRVDIVASSSSGPGIPVAGEAAVDEVCLSLKTNKLHLAKGHSFVL